MKKIVFTALIFVFAFSLYIAYEHTKNEELEKLETLEEKIATSFVIPEDFPLVPDEAYPLLVELATEFQINIFRSGYNFKPDDQTVILKYVLLTGETDFFDHLRLADGRVLQPADTQQGSFFISSAKTDDEHQIGRIRHLGRELITIQPLQTAYEFLPVEGRYFAEADEESFRLFLESFSEQVNTSMERLGTPLEEPYTPEHFLQGGTETEPYATSLIAFLLYINYALFVMIAVLLLYYMFSSSKQVGIMKMHGVANIRIWWVVVGRLISAAVMIAALGALLLAIVLYAPASFVYQTLVQLLQAYLILIVFSLVTYAYITKIKVSQTIKNRKDTQGIFVLNTLLKAVCSIVLIFVGLDMFEKYAEIRTQQKDLKNWEHTKDYGVIYPFLIGYDSEDLQTGGARIDAAIEDELYPILNAMGSVYIEASDYEEMNLLLNHDYDGIFSVQVNPNYLQEFPVYDTENNPVQVSEEETNWILLVSEQYKDREEEILRFFKEARKEMRRANGIGEVPEKIEHQDTEIIWLAHDQYIFSFNPDVFPAEQSVIKDPIIQVITEGNSVAADRNSILGGGATDPLKVKLIDRDTALTYEKLLPELERLQLDDNFKHLITVDQYMLQNIHTLQREMIIVLLVMLGLIVALLFLVVQNLIVFFHKHQQRFVVHRLFGIGFFRTYNVYFVWLALTWGGLVLLSLVLNEGLEIRLVDGVVDLPFLSVVGILIGMELLASAIALTAIERRHKVKLIKGGD